MNKTKYSVQYHYIVDGSMTVEADSEEDAREFVWRTINDLTEGKVDNQLDWVKKV